MKITILGSGTSTGVPQVGCTCPVCTSTDPRDRRLRCSGLVEVDGVRILIDCGPDFREQMLRLEDFGPIDAVLITHEHYDHVGGLDDLRPFCQFKDVPVYAEDYTAERLQQRIPYCFVEHPYPGVPRIPLHRIEPGKPFSVAGMHGNTVEITPFRVMHGKMPILAFRIGDIIEATVVKITGDNVDLSTIDRECGVLKAMCTRCRGYMQTTEKENELQCKRCSKKEKREVSTNYVNE